MAQATIQDVVVVPAVAEVRRKTVVLELEVSEAEGLQTLLNSGVTGRVLERLEISDVLSALNRSGLIPGTARFESYATMRP